MPPYLGDASELPRADPRPDSGRSGREGSKADILARTEVAPMSDGGFGTSLWKNVRAVTFGKDGGIEAPVRANGRDGIEVGLGAIAEGEARGAQEDRTGVASTRRRWRR